MLELLQLASGCCPTFSLGCRSQIGSTWFTGSSY